MTFSIVARCADTGMFGVGIASSSPAVAARCAFAQAGVGAVTTQNITDPALGPQLLRQLAEGDDATTALRKVITASAFAGYRQLQAIDARGITAQHSGDHALGIVAMARTADAAAAGNLLHNDGVPQAMVDAFGASTGHLGERLLCALIAARTAGGEAGPVHSAGLLVVHEVSWPIVDLRIDWDEHDPIHALQALWLRFQPQIQDYVTRALHPDGAPAFGVAGDPHR